MERLTKYITPVGMCMTNLNSMKHYMPCVPCREKAQLKKDLKGNMYTEKFGFCDTCEVKMLFNRLKEYEDAEEQGLLLKLPCKEVYESSGDSVYYIYDYEIVECVNCGVTVDADGKVWITIASDEEIFPYRNPDPEHDLDPTDWCQNVTSVFGEEFGKTVFLTREEAEAKLKELQNNGSK